MKSGSWWMRYGSSCARKVNGSRASVVTSAVMLCVMLWVAPGAMGDSFEHATNAPAARTAAIRLARLRGDMGDLLPAACLEKPTPRRSQHLRWRANMHRGVQLARIAAEASARREAQGAIEKGPPAMPSGPLKIAPPGIEPGLS